MEAARVQEAVAELLAEWPKAGSTDPVKYLIEKFESKEFAERTHQKRDSVPHGTFCCPRILARPLSIIVLGASGDLARKKTFPALFTLYRRGLLPPAVNIVGYARSPMERPKLESQISSAFPTDDCDDEKAEFLERCTYVNGPYDEVKGFSALIQHLEGLEGPCSIANRVFYLALPPTAFVGACTCISQSGMKNEAAGGWSRVIVEKPFGRDSESSKQLTNALAPLLREDQLFRIDHYLGKEMVQSLVTLRFANHLFSSIWNRKHIANVQITFKEQIGTQGRGGYFDNFGIIRDVIQNHLTQILALVAMEKPRDLSAEAIRDEKVRVLQHVQPATVKDCVLGQYTAPADGSEPGYLDDSTVPKGSRCPTFAALALTVRNDRWDGVPFILKAGKATEGKKVEVRIQFRDEVLPFEDRTQRNELVIRAQPKEAMYLKISTKAPGMSQDVIQTELDLSYHQRFDGVTLPEAYESLINEVIVGNSTNFVRADELEAAWAIFTPLLHTIDDGAVPLYPYEMGTRGPVEADALVQRLGYRRTHRYVTSSPLMSE